MSHFHRLKLASAIGLTLALISGVVSLSGKLSSEAERALALAVELAQNVRGVRSVQTKGLTL